MNSFSKCLLTTSIHPKKITKIKNGYSFQEKEKTYYYFKKRKNTKRLKEELWEIGYDSFGIPIWEEEDYELYVVEESFVSEKEWIQVLSLLHQKTMEEEEVSKEWIQNIQKEQEDIHSYYSSFQETIEQVPFPRMDYYTLLINISLFYHCMNLSNQYFMSWKKTSLKKGLLLGNLSLWNLKKEKEKYYFLDYGDSKKGYLIEELYSFFQKYPNIELFQEYEKICNLEEDQKLLWSLLLFPKKIIFTKNIYQTTSQIHAEITRLLNLLSFLEKDKKDEETNKEEFNE